MNSAIIAALLSSRALAHMFYRDSTFSPPVDGVASVPMHLMFRCSPGGSVPDNSALASLVQAIYFEKYHEANRIPRPLLEELLLLNH